MEADIRDIAGMRDRLRNRYSTYDPDNLAHRVGKVAKDLNYMRLLGGVVAASIPDVARTVAANGMMRVFGKTLIPLITKVKASKPLREEIHRMGIAVDDVINGRAQIIADVNDYTKGKTAFERGTAAAANKFSNINLMNQWTKGIKTVSAIAMQTRLVETLTSGKIPKEFKRLGISDDDAKNIAELLKKHATQAEGGNYMVNRDLWGNPALERAWANAMRKEVDRVIVTPGQEKPLFMSDMGWSVVFQFKTFMMSATNKILLAGLQGQDAKYIQSVVGMITLGAMSYAFKEWDAGREVSDDPMVWVTEGIDRSGMLGILMEVNNTTEKLSGNNIGIRKLMGVASPASRYASRSALDSAVGPTWGLAGDMIKIASAASGESEWKESDTRAVRRLIPAQNLSLLRQLFDKLEEGIGE